MLSATAMSVKLCLKAVEVSQLTQKIASNLEGFVCAYSRAISVFPTPRRPYMVYDRRLFALWPRKLSTFFSSSVRPKKFSLLALGIIRMGNVTCSSGYWVGPCRRLRVFVKRSRLTVEKLLISFKCFVAASIALRLSLIFFSTLLQLEPDAASASGEIC